jgi:ribonuclease HI
MIHKQGIDDSGMTDESRKIEVELYTDGACSGNPGPGGWACILRHLPTGKETEVSGGCLETTNNQMELKAVVEGLAKLKRSVRIELFTDSVYVGKGMTEWMPKWKKNGWKRKEKSRLVPVKNVELWQQLDLLMQRHSVKYTRVAGHSGHPENDRCDELAVAAYQKYLR